MLSALLHLSPLEDQAQAEKEEKLMEKAMGIKAGGQEEVKAEDASASATAAASSSSASSASAISSTTAVAVTTASPSSTPVRLRRRPLRSTLTSSQVALSSLVISHYLPAVCSMLVREMKSHTLIRDFLLRHWTTKVISFTLMEEEEWKGMKKQEEEETINKGEGTDASSASFASASTSSSSSTTASSATSSLPPQPSVSFSLMLRNCGVRILKNGDFDIFALSSSLGRGISDLKEIKLVELLDKAKNEAMPLSMRSV